MATVDLSSIDDFKIKTLFDFFDRDKDGSITAQEIQQTCDHLEYKISDDEIQSFFKAQNIDSSGAIDFETFRRIFIN